MKPRAPTQWLSHDLAPSMVIVAGVAMLLYARAASFGFYYDDPAPDFQVVERYTLAQICLTNVGYGYYRPIVFAIWKLLLALSGGHYGPAFHTLLIALHGANAALLWLLAYRLSDRRAYAWMAALAFATFPFSYEAVAYVAALCHPLLVFFALCMFLFYLRLRATRRILYYLGAYLSLLLALFTHENGIVLPVILLAWDALIRRPRSVREWISRPVLSFLVAPVAFGLIRLGILKSGDHALRSLRYIARNSVPFLQALSYPVLPFMHLAHGDRLSLALLACGVIVGAFFLSWIARARKLWFFALSWFSLAMFPSILFLERDYLYHGPRLFYLSSVGVALLWAILPLAVERLTGPSVLRRHLVRGLQLVLAALVVLVPLPFIQCQINFMAHISLLLRGMRDCAIAAPPGRDLVFVNLPYYFTGYREHPNGCANPYPAISLASIVFPPYSDARQFIRVNGGPDRPARAVHYAGYAPSWVPFGEEVSAVILRDLLPVAEVFVCDVESGAFHDLSQLWSAGGLPGPQDSRFPWRFVAPLADPPELAKPGELAAARSCGLLFGDALELVAYRVEPQAVLPGETATLTLYWWAKGPERPVLKAHLRLRDRFGNPVIEHNLWPVPGLPTSVWEVDTIYATRLTLELPQQAAMGLATLELALSPEPGGFPLSATSAVGEPLGTTPKVGTLLVGQSSNAAPSEAPPSHTRQEVLGDSISLLGYDLPSERLRPGDTLALTLYWRAAEEVGRSYTVFVQLLNARGERAAGQDSEPNGGRYPTSAWTLQVAIRDVHDVPLPPNLAPGRYTLIVGMYEWPSMQRLAVTLDGAAQGDAVQLGEITIGE